MAVLLVFSIVSLAVFFQSKPLTRFARSLIQGSRPPTATFEHFTGEGVMVTVALASAMIWVGICPIFKNWKLADLVLSHFGSSQSGQMDHLPLLGLSTSARGDIRTKSSDSESLG